MAEEHKFKASITWTGNKGQGTANTKSYDRSHTISAENKPDILCSMDPAFHGDKTKYNPEDLFVASVSSCHMLWYLFLCAQEGVILVDYKDNATGTMVINTDESGHFTEITLNPVVTVTDKLMIAK